jgi:hypothetical protein
MNIHESNNVHSSDDMADTEMIQEKIGLAMAWKGQPKRRSKHLTRVDS